MGIDSGTYGTPRAELGEALREYVANQDMFIGTKLFPTTNVVKQAASVSVITRESLMGGADVKRASRSNYNRVSLGVDDMSYSCKEHGLEGQLDASEVRLYASDFDAERETVNDLMTKLLRAQDQRVAACVSESTFATAATFTHCSAAWATKTTNIVKDVQDARLKGFNLCGLELNTLTVNRTTLNRIMTNDDVKDAIKYVQGADWATVMGALARILGVERLLVGGGVYNGKPEGATAASPTVIWPSRYALLSVTPMDGNIVAPSLGRTFMWAEDAAQNVVVESYEEPQTRSTVYRVRQHTDEKLIDVNFGQLIDVENAS